MRTPEPAIAFRDLVAYTDYLAQRWLNYFKNNPKALEIEVGGRAPKLRDLVTHIFQVEHFFSMLLLQDDMTDDRRPAPIEAKNFEDLERMHRETNESLTQYLGTTDEERL